jgi:SPP1 family predicted phage head-tail adaptor
MADINKYRSRLKIEYATNVANSVGGFVQTWAVLDTVWGVIKPISDVEILKYGQMYSTAKYKAQIRYRPDMLLNKRYRISYQNRCYNITGVLDLENTKDEMVLLLDDVQAAQAAQ